MVEQLTLDKFLSTLSSKEPVPGGGGASALAGALGNALGQMVANLTIGKKRYADVEDEIKGLLARMEDLQKEFVILADRDEEVFAPLAAAYGLPTGTEEEKAHKAAVMEQRLLDASYVPLEVMEKAVEMLGILDVLAVKGSPCTSSLIFAETSAPFNTCIGVHSSFFTQRRYRYPLSPARTTP